MSKKVTKSPLAEVQSAISTAWKSYLNGLTPRLKLIDIFLSFLVFLGILQFVYVILVGNFPFNAFLGGFISCVGQFVLTVSLRLQYVNHSKSLSEKKKNDQDLKVESNFFETITPERALGDYIFASLILHFTVLHFIN